MRQTIRHFHLFAGLGGGAAGFNNGHARVGQARAAFRCLGGVDSSPAAMRDFERLTGVPGTALDLFSRAQYRAFHGQEPPADWREATPADLRRAAGNERPHVVFSSPPCKGFSALLNEQQSTGVKYQALNDLTVRGVWLALEAWADDPPEFFLLENVPRIQNRGRPLLDRIQDLLAAYGYATAETTHDCGELGGLAQSRQRFLLVGRHQEKVPPFLYEPEKRSLGSVGEVLERLPVPGGYGGMHRLPSLQWRTWVRLALVKAGSDWRSLERLRVEDGMLADYGIVPEEPPYGGAYGVLNWRDNAGTITGKAGKVGCGRFSVADPRPGFSGEYGQYGVKGWAATSGAVSGKAGPGSGRYSVQDPRLETGGNRPVYRLVECDEGRMSVAADPAPTLPEPEAQGVYRIRALDGSWHRPFTTLELAALQGLVDPEADFDLDGTSDAAWRERIGNAVPPPAASAIASVMGDTLLLAWAGETFTLGATPIWVRPVAVAAATGPAGLGSACPGTA